MLFVLGSCDDLELCVRGSNRWMTMKNLMLEDTGTQRSDRMWHWGIGFYRRPCLSRSEFIIYLEKFYDDVRKVNVSLLPS